MATTDIEIIKERLAGQAGTYGLAASATSGIDSLTDFSVTFTKASDDAMASTTTSETYTGMMVPRRGILKAVYYTATTGGITAHASNYATITISKRSSSAGSKTTVATFSTDTVTTDDVTQGAPKSMDLATGTAAIVDANSTITFEIAKPGSGVVVRAGTFTLVFSRA